MPIFFFVNMYTISFGQLAKQTYFLHHLIPPPFQIK